MVFFFFFPAEETGVFKVGVFKEEGEEGFFIATGLVLCLPTLTLFGFFPTMDFRLTDAAIMPGVAVAFDFVFPAVGVVVVLVFPLPFPWLLGLPVTAAGVAVADVAVVVVSVVVKLFLCGFLSTSTPLPATVVAGDTSLFLVFLLFCLGSVVLEGGVAVLVVGTLILSWGSSGGGCCSLCGSVVTNDAEEDDLVDDRLAARVCRVVVVVVLLSSAAAVSSIERFRLVGVVVSPFGF